MQMPKDSGSTQARLLRFLEELTQDANAQSYGEHYCIPASLRNVLLFHGITVLQTEIVEHHYAHYPGLVGKRPPTSACDRDSSIEFADLGIVRRFLSTKSSSVEDEFLCCADGKSSGGPVAAVERAINEGYPVMLSLRSGRHAAHVVVISAILNDHFYYHDPAENKVKRVSRQRLEELVHPQWQLVIVRPRRKTAD